MKAPTKPIFFLVNPKRVPYQTIKYATDNNPYETPCIFKYM